MSLSVYHQIDLPLVELGFDLRSSGRSRLEIRDAVLLEYKRLGVGDSTAEKRWYLVASPVFSTNSITDHVVRYWNSTAEHDRKELCICACLGAFPVLNEVLDAVMHISAIRGTAAQMEVRMRLSKRYGARPSLKQAVQKCLQSLRSWEIITSPKPGVDVPRIPVICSSVVGSAAIASQMVHRFEDGLRIENVASRSPLSLWDFSTYAPNDGHCIDVRVGARGREYVVVE